MKITTCRTRAAVGSASLPRSQAVAELLLMQVLSHLKLSITTAQKHCHSLACCCLRAGESAGHWEVLPRWHEVNTCQPKRPIMIQAKTCAATLFFLPTLAFDREGFDVCRAAQQKIVAPMGRPCFRGVIHGAKLRSMNQDKSEALERDHGKAVNNNSRRADHLNHDDALDSIRAQ